MKNQFFNPFKFVLVVSLIFLFTNTVVAQMFLDGKWEVRCAIESVDASSAKFCGICPHNIDKAKSSMSIGTLEFSFNEKNLIIKPEGEQKGEECKIKTDDIKNSIEFKYNNENYAFDVMLVDANNKILREHKTGLLLLLTKK
jgi:hypothetical protein